VKLILIPLGILAFLVFLLLLGGFGLLCALAIISAFTWLFRFLTGPRGGRARGAGRPNPVASAWRRMPLRK
jgi:hypothetical protein